MEIERVATAATDLDIAGFPAKLLHRVREIEGNAVLLDTNENQDMHVLVEQAGKGGRLKAFVIDQNECQGSIPVPVTFRRWSNL